MSLNTRNHLIKILSEALIDSSYSLELSTELRASYILNQIAKAGYLREESSVHVNELDDKELISPFKCKVE